MSSAPESDVIRGPWGPFMDVVMCLLPIIVLVYTTLKTNPLPTTKSLPLSAFIMWFVRLAYLSSDPLETCALVVSGVLSALTPITIVAGAIFLFESMESSRCLDWMRVRMKELSGAHPVAEIMLIGFVFPYIIEGASGFGTPAALASPMLMSMGHPKLETVSCLLLMNTFATVFGAVGTPVWFGLGPATRNDPALLRAVGLRCALGMGVAAVLLVPVIVGMLVPRSEVKRNILFILLSTASCSVPSIAISTFSYEFPSLLGGIVGMFITGGLIYFKVGLAPYDHVAREHQTQDPEAGIAMPTAAAGPAAATGEGTTPSLGSRRHTDEVEDHHEGTALTGGPGKAAPPAIMGLRSFSGKGGKRKQPPPPPPGEPMHASGEGEQGVGAAAPPPPHGESGHEDAGPPGGSTSRPKPGSRVKNFLFSSGTSHVAPDDVHVQHHAEGDHGEARDGDGQDESEGGDPEAEAADAARVAGETGFLSYVSRTLPLWLTVLLLIVTRIEEVGIRDVFKESTQRSFDEPLGTLGRIWLSWSGVLGFDRILSTSVGWSYEILYVPFIVPFVIAGSAGLAVFRDQLKMAPLAIAKKTAGRMVKPAISLFGALALVQMLRGVSGDKGAPAYVVGVTVSDALSHGWIILCAPIGILGSFFSGSTTVSNLTFGDVQSVAAARLGVSQAGMLALQSLGATMGNAICLNNIIAVSAVVGLKVSEGVVMMRTGPITGLFYVIATALMIPFIYGSGIEQTGTA